MDIEMPFLSALQRIADALEESNKISRENTELTKELFEQNRDWIEWNKAIRQENIEIEEKRYDLALQKNDDRANAFNEEVLDLYRQGSIGFTSIKNDNRGDDKDE